MASAQASAPQTWNRYSYGLNNPLKYIDPSGLNSDDIGTAEDQRRQQEEQQRQQQLPPGLPPPPGGPVAPGPIKIDIGKPPPPIVSTVTFVTGDSEEHINRPIGDSTYFTGVGSIIQLTARDAAGNAITGITVTETVVSAQGTTVRQRATPFPVDSDGSFPDLVGVGLTPPPSTPISQAEADNILGRIAQRRTQQMTYQTLRFYAPQGHLIGTAVVERIFTNLDGNGNVRPTSNPRGRPVDNYSTKVKLLAMVPLQ